MGKKEGKNTSNFYVLSARHSGSSVLQPNHCTHMLIWASQTPQYTPSPQPPTPKPTQDTHCLFQSQDPDGSSLIWVASAEEKKRRLRKEGLGLWSVGNQCIWVGFEPSVCEMLQFRRDEEERINRLIETLSEDIDRKLNSPSAMLLRTKYVVKDFPFLAVEIFYTCCAVMVRFLERAGCGS